MHNLVRQSTYIIILSVLLGFIRYSFLDQYKLFDNDDTSIQIVETDLKKYLNSIDTPESVDISFAKSAYDKKLVVFIDAREFIDFNEGHIKGAINLPYDPEIDYNKQLLDSLFYLDKTLIIYCSGEGCSLSEDLSYDLYENYDFYSVLYFEGGYPEWKKLNYPINEGIKDNVSKPMDKSFFTFIDYIIIISIAFMIGFYFTDSYRYFIPIISRLILGFIFIYFSWDKIIDPSLFAKLVTNYDIVPSNLINIGVLVLPWIELIIGICLILGVFIDTSILISLSMLSLFILMIFQAFLRGKSIDCGCLLSDISDTSAYNKRIHMIQRIIQDICFIGYAVIVKYRTIFKAKMTKKVTLILFLLIHFLYPANNVFRIIASANINNEIDPCG